MGSWLATQGAKIAMAMIATRTSSDSAEISGTRGRPIRRRRGAGRISGTGLFMVESSVADAWIADRIRQIDQQIDDDIHTAGQQDHALNHRVVPGQHGV